MAVSHQDATHINAELAHHLTGRQLRAVGAPILFWVGHEVSVSPHDAKRCPHGLECLDQVFRLADAVPTEG